MFVKENPDIKKSEKNKNKQVDDAHDTDSVMPMYNLIEYIWKHGEVYGNTIEMNQP